MKVIPKRTFLLRQDDMDGGKKIDIVVRTGELAEVSEKEYARFKTDFDKLDPKKK